MSHLICHGDEYSEQKEKIYSKAVVSDLKIKILIEESSASGENERYNCKCNTFS
jgi:hypothetical protein